MDRIAIQVNQVELYRGIYMPFFNFSSTYHFQNSNVNLTVSQLAPSLKLSPNSFVRRLTNIYDVNGQVNKPLTPTIFVRMRRGSGRRPSRVAPVN